MLTATDGSPDTFRIKIWDDHGVVYDNEIGAGNAPAPQESTGTSGQAGLAPTVFVVEHEIYQTDLRSYHGIEDASPANQEQHAHCRCRAPDRAGPAYDETAASYLTSTH